MAARTRLLQTAIAVVNLVIVVLAFTSIWPFPSGDFKVDLPSPSEVIWSYSDGVVHVSAPYAIDNGGFYDVEDLVISYRVTNYTSSAMASDTFELGTVPAGEVTRDTIDFEIDLLGLYNSGIQWMIFNDDILNFAIDVDCLYTSRLVEFHADYRVSVPWEPLIQGYGIELPQSLPIPGTQYSVDYWLRTSDLLRSLPAATVTLQLLDGGGVVDTVQQNVQLGGNRSGTVTFEVPTAYNPPYSIVLTIDVLEYTFSERWEL